MDDLIDDVEIQASPAAGHSSKPQTGHAHDTQHHSPHKNDLPLADPADLTAIKNDPTIKLNIDTTIRWNAAKLRYIPS